MCTVAWFRVPFLGETLEGAEGAFSGVQVLRLTYSVCRSIPRSDHAARCWPTAS
jgi:hypothetical protein